MIRGAGFATVETRIMQHRKIFHLLLVSHIVVLCFGLDFVATTVPMTSTATSREIAC